MIKELKLSFNYNKYVKIYNKFTNMLSKWTMFPGTIKKTNSIFIV